MPEVWKPIPSYEGLYEVSNLGKVRSLDRKVFWERFQVYTTKHGKILKFKIDRAGYRRVTLYKDDKARHWYVHRLVLLAFVGLPQNNQECCHNDGSRTNNTLSNLRWDTKESNMKDTMKHGTSYFSTQKGIKNANAKLNDKIVKEIRNRSNENQYTLAKEYGVSQVTIWKVIAKKIWKHIS